MTRALVRSVPVLVQGGLPVLFVTDPVDHVGFAERQRKVGGELHAQAVQVPEEPPRGPGVIGADQHLLSSQGSSVVEEAFGQLCRRGVEDPDVVLGAIRSRVAWQQCRSEDFPGSVACTVIEKGDERGEPAFGLVGARRRSPCSEREVTSVASMAMMSGFAASRLCQFSHRCWSRRDNGGRISSCHDYSSFPPRFMV